MILYLTHGNGEESIPLKLPASSSQVDEIDIRLDDICSGEGNFRISDVGRKRPHTTTTQLICPQMSEFIGSCGNSTLGTFPCMFSSYLMKDRPTYDLKRGAKNEKTDLYPAGSTPAPYSACRLRRLGLRKARGSRV